MRKMTVRHSITDVARRVRSTCFPTAVFLLLSQVLIFALLAGENGSLPLDPSGVPGPLLISGGRSAEEVLDRFVELAGGEHANIVAVVTASPAADAMFGDEAYESRWRFPWAVRGVKNIQLVHAYTREDAEEPLTADLLKDATAVWFCGGVQSRVTERFRGSAFEKAMLAFHRRGGLIGGTSAGAALQSQVMIARGKDRPDIDVGFDLLPGAIIDQHFLVRKRIGRLKLAVKQHPNLVGFGIDEATAVIVRGRQLEVLGESTVTVVFAEGNGYPEREIVLNPGPKYDLTTLRRAAVARTAPAPVEARPAAVKEGSLVIVGGGGTPKDAVSNFIRLAGGADAPIVILPTALPDPLPPLEKLPEVVMFERAGAKNMKILTARSRDQVESPEFVEAMKHARGVWFGGGRQWRFVDAYAGTKAESLFHDVLRRGGVIGGSSAGASIQGDLLCRGNPLGNEEILCEGYDRGFGFLPGTAIDQHFSQRNRLNDMLNLTKLRPDVLGIGIDEGTALLVHGTAAEVVGAGKVFFFPDAQRRSVDEPYLAMAAGAKFDLAACRAIEAAEDAKTAPSETSATTTKADESSVAAQTPMGQ